MLVLPKAKLGAKILDKIEQFGGFEKTEKSLDSLSDMIPGGGRKRDRLTNGKFEGMGS